ncbi:MAG: hypothetical protein MI824_05310 [Hyphomicrobiales bacterium]|nr:hypothetical protein [Hyphomicrobiales bacterium]
MGRWSFHPQSQKNLRPPGREARAWNADIDREAEKTRAKSLQKRPNPMGIRAWERAGTQDAAAWAVQGPHDPPSERHGSDVFLGPVEVRLADAGFARLAQL